MTFPSAAKAMHFLVATGVAREVTGQRRNRVFTLRRLSQHPEQGRPTAVKHRWIPFNSPPLLRTTQGINRNGDRPGAATKCVVKRRKLEIVCPGKGHQVAVRDVGVAGHGGEV